MKSLDILLLLKVTSIYAQEEKLLESHFSAAELNSDFSSNVLVCERGDENYLLGLLSSELGLNNGEVSNSIVRCREAGLMMNDYETSRLTVNRRALFSICEHALKYFFPVGPGAIVRGLSTGFSVPVLSSKLRSAGGRQTVWPDPLGNEFGQAIVPLYKTIPYAARKDQTLYIYLALIDAIRIGGPRESEVAASLLKTVIGI